MATKDHNRQNGGGENAPPLEATEQIADIESVLATADLEPVYIRLPQPYTGGIRVRPLTMQEIAAAQASARKRVRMPDQTWGWETSADDINKQMILLSVIEPALSPDQYDALMRKNYNLMTTILAAVTKINGVSIEAIQEVLEEVGNQF